METRDEHCAFHGDASVSWLRILAMASATRFEHEGWIA